MVTELWDFSVSIKVLAPPRRTGDNRRVCRRMAQCCNERQAAEETLAAPVIFLLVVTFLATTERAVGKFENLEGQAEIKGL
jgi:hypothetical protein